MTQIACMRCSKLAELQFSEEDGGLLFDEIEVSVEHGILAYICEECMTDEEVVAAARRSASALLDAAEEQMASLEMIFERIPKTKDDPRFKEQYAEAQRLMNEARIALQALLGEDNAP